MVCKQCADCIWADICIADSRCAHYAPFDEKKIEKNEEKQAETERIEFYREWFKYNRRCYD